MTRRRARREGCPVCSELDDDEAATLAPAAASPEMLPATIQGSGSLWVRVCPLGAYNFNLYSTPRHRDQQ